MSDTPGDRILLLEAAPHALPTAEFSFVCLRVSFVGHFLSHWMQINKKENFFLREFTMCFSGLRDCLP